MVEGPVGRAASTREAAEAWEALFRAQVALMRRFQRDDVWDPLTIREYDVLFTAPPSQFASLKSGLDGVVDAWHWSK